MLVEDGDEIVPGITAFMTPGHTPGCCSYILSQEIFFGKELFLLNCAYTGLDIAFLGEEAKVEEAIRENDKALEKLFSEMGLVSPQELYRRQRMPEEELPD